MSSLFTSGLTSLFSPALLRRHQRHARKIIAVAAGVARQDAATQHSRVGANKEIRKDVGLDTTLAAVLDECAPRQEQRWAGNFLKTQTEAFDYLVQCFD